MLSMAENNINELDTLLRSRQVPPPRSNLSERIIDAALQEKPKRRSGFMQGLDGLADLFVLPSLSEGSSLAIQEAMAAGLPVITTTAAGSIIKDGHNGILVPPRDRNALVKAVTRLLLDRAFAVKLGERAKSAISTQLAEGYGTRVNAAYDRILTRHG